ncbi:MAG: tetratricopeptide repeat protein [Bryobacter sp.]|nr:tetratricopeptide repeat protein [Bryobacter sp.]
MRRTLGLGLLLAALTLAQTPEALLGAALHQERVTGNLQAAIDGFKKVLASPGVPRAVAAQAQYHLGVCYEKLGNQEARKAFEAVVKNYGDQKDLAAQARAHLSAMTGESSSVRARLLWDNLRDFSGTTSADGRYLSFVDRMTGDVSIRDLVTGAERHVTNRISSAVALGTTETTALSPDGKRVAFVWDAWDEEALKNKDYFQVRVINADGTGERTLLRPKGYCEVGSWSPDGKWIAAYVQPDLNRENNYQVMLFAPDTGESRTLRSKGLWPKSRIRFSPDGKWLAYDERASANQPPTLYLLPTNGSAVSETELEKDAQMIGWAPEGNGILFSRPRGNMAALFFVPIREGKPAGPSQPLYTASNIGHPLGLTTSGTLIFGLENSKRDGWIAEWDDRAGRIGSVIAQFPGEEILPPMNDNGLKFSPDGSQLLWLVRPNRLHFRSPSGDRQSSVSAQMKDIQRVAWGHDGRFVLAAGIGTDGSTGLFRVDPATGISQLLSSKVDLDRVAFAVSPDGKTIFHRTKDSKIAALDLETGSNRILYEKFFGVPNMLPSHDGKQLAIRAGGLLGVLDLASGRYVELYARDFNSDHRVMWGLAWSADNRRVLVIARDYRTAKCELWIYPAEGGSPVIQSLSTEMAGLSLSPDGKRAATLRREMRRQVWALENFLPAKR